MSILRQVHAPADAIIVPDAQLLFHGDFKRAGNDLVVSKDRPRFCPARLLQGREARRDCIPDGAHLTGDIINALVGEVHVSQAGNAQLASQVIGHVTKLQGSATIVRNGVSIILNMGDNVEKGDVVESGSNSTLGLTFIDGTVFGLSANARMVLNEMVYDPNGSSNSSLMSLVAGTITFVAGETAKHGDMKVDTPVATMGIRGTAVPGGDRLHGPGVPVAGSQPGQPAPGPNASFQVLVEPDGTTGSYILFDKTTLQPIAIVNQAGQQLNINNGIISQTTTPLSPEIQKLITDVFQQKFSDNTNSNTKTTTAQTDSIIPTSNGFIIKLADGSIAQAFTANSGAGSLNPNVAPPSNNFNHLSGFLTLNSLGILGVPEVLFQTAELAGQTNDKFDFVHAGGTFHFEDINVGDRPSVTADFSSVTYTNAAGTFTINDGQTSAAGLSPLQFKDIAATAIKLFMAPSPGNTNNGDVTWIYSVHDNAFDFLAAGEKLTFTYHVVLNNNFAAAPESKGLDITITVTGTNDRPQFSTDTPAPVIDFAAGTKTSGGNLPTHNPTSGDLAFADVDLTDKHTVSVALTDAEMSNGGTIPPLPLSLFNDPKTLSVSIETDSTGTGNGVIHWQLADLPVYVADFIPANQTVTLTYTVTLTDSSGDLPTDSTTETITVVITGTNDAAEVWIHTTTDGHDNLWTNGLNWETGLAPSATDDAIIITDQLHPNTPAYPATVDVTTAVAHSVTMNDFAAQSTDPAHQAPELDVLSGAKLTIGADLSLSADSRLVNFGTVIVGGKLELMDAVDPQTHEVSLNLSEILNSGALNLGQGGDIQGKAKVTNTGTIDLQAGILNVLVDIANSDGESAGKIKVDQGATLALGSDANNPGAKGGITGGTITVAGTLTLEQAIITDAATTNTSTGEIDLNGSAVLTGGTLDNAGKLKVSGAGNALHHETVTANNLIEVVAGAILTVDLISTIANGTLTIDDAGKLVLDSATIDGGIINNGTPTGTLGQFGAIEIKGSSKFDQGATLNNGFVTFDASPSQTVTLTLDNVTVNGTTITENVGSSIEIDETVKLTGNATIQGQSNSQPGNITNLGTLDITGAATLHDVSVANDHHVVQIESGVTLNLNNSTITGGTLNINGTLDSTGDSFITGVTIDNTANIHVSGGTLTIDPTPTFDNSGTILVTDGGKLVLDHEIISNGAADNHVADGKIQVDTAPGHVSTLDLNDFAIHGGSVVVSGELDSTGDSAISSAITNTGTIEVESGTLTLGGSVSGSGHIVIDAGATLALSGSDSQAIEFADGGNSKLELLAGSSLSSTATIEGLAVGDEIDLSAIDYKLASATFVNGVLEVTDGTHTVDLTLSGDFSKLYFAGTNDGSGGTLVTIKDTDDAPVIADADKSELKTISELTATTGSSQTDYPGGTIISPISI